VIDKHVTLKYQQKFGQHYIQNPNINISKKYFTDYDYLETELLANSEHFHQQNLINLQREQHLIKVGQAQAHLQSQVYYQSQMMKQSNLHRNNPKIDFGQRQQHNQFKNPSYQPQMVNNNPNLVYNQYGQANFSGQYHQPNLPQGRNITSIMHIHNDPSDKNNNPIQQQTMTMLEMNYHAQNSNGQYNNQKIGHNYSEKQHLYMQQLEDFYSQARYGRDNYQNCEPNPVQQQQQQQQQYQNQSQNDFEGYNVNSYNTDKQ